MEARRLAFSSVVSYHTNTHGCGVARFSQQLASHLGVPFVGFDAKWGTAPLFSLKWSELTPDDRDNWRDAITYVQDLGSDVSVFWHDKGDEAITNCAEHVFYADPSLGTPGLWCPSLLHDQPVPRAAINLFAMGMIGKVQVEPYRKLADLIAQTPHTFHLRMSMGLHEGTDLSEALLKCEALSQAIGPENLSVLGILTDTAVASEYAQCHAVCAFFEQGARANNTTIHAAMRAWKPVMTNLDAQSPPDWTHGVSVFDVHQMTAWPSVFELERVAARGFLLSANYSWDALISAMRKECDKSRSMAV